MRRGRLLLLALSTLVVASVAAGTGPERANAAEPQRLFALDARQGALAPLPERPGFYRLVLERVRARAIYFTDRPAREVGTIRVRPMLRRLFAGDSPDPNAAVNATAPGRGQLLMGVELRGWRYSARRQKLTLRVRHLKQGGPTIARVPEDVVLPRSFRDVSMFIDDCCGAGAAATAFNPGQLDLTLAINNGPELELPSASPETWLPGSAPIGFAPAGPRPGALGPGTNYLTVAPAGGISPLTVALDLPGALPYDSLQLYVFLGSSTVTCTVLDDGRLVAFASVPAAF